MLSVNTSRCLALIWWNFNPLVFSHLNYSLPVWGPSTHQNQWRSMTMLLNIIVHSSGCICSIKFNVDVSVSWITNIIITIVLLYVHQITVQAIPPIWHLHTMRDVDYCLLKKITTLVHPLVEFFASRCYIWETFSYNVFNYLCTLVELY